MSYSVRNDLAGEMDRLRERAADDEHHFYGAWRGPRPVRAALARVEGETAHDKWRAGGGDEAVNEFIDKAYATAGKVAGTKPNGVDLLPYQYDIGAGQSVPSTLAVYRGADGKRAGYLLYTDAWHGYNNRTNGPAILSVEVMPSLRGKGVGTAMYDYIQDNTQLNLYPAIGGTNQFTAPGKAFAQAWLTHRLQVERGRAGIREAAQAQRTALAQVQDALARVGRAKVALVGMPSPEESQQLREASDDHHFYGAWHGPRRGQAQADYASGRAFAINARLRSGEPQTESNDAATVAGLDAAMTPLPKPVDVHRFLGGPQVFGYPENNVPFPKTNEFDKWTPATYDAALSTFGKPVLDVHRNGIIGKVFTDKGFMSTTSLSDLSGTPSQGGFGDPITHPIRLDLHVPAGVLATPLGAFSSWGEGELLLERGLSFRVTGIAKTTKVDHWGGRQREYPFWIVTADVVPPGFSEARTDDDETHHFYGAWHGPRVSKAALRAYGQGRQYEFGAIDHLPPAQQAALTAAMSQLADRKDNERAIVIGADGRPILDKVGDKSAVEFSDAEAAQMANAHLMHNHPSGSPFSNDDVSLAALQNLASINAVGTDASGSKWRFSLLRPKAGWPSIGGQPDRYGLMTAFAKGHVVGEDRWRQLLQAGGWDTTSPADHSTPSYAAWADAANRATNDAMNLDRQAVAEALGAQYERVAWH